MDIQQSQKAEFIRLLEQATPNEGPNRTQLNHVGVARIAQPQERLPVMYEPALIMLGQGTKICHLGDRAFTYRAWEYLILFLPMPLEVTIYDVSSDHPALMIGFRIDLSRLAKVSLRLDDVDASVAHASHNDETTGIYTAPIKAGLLDAAIRMLRALSDPVDAAMLGEAILDEIYYRILREDREGALRLLLQKQAQIKQIARAVDHIHHNLDQNISVEALAAMVNMSATTFYRNFKEVMHLPPLQYAKSIKLHRAQALIREGKRATEAGYFVGYNSPAQFSREYKRQFGYAPSDTVTG
ncbi:AraC family transcriptional regulator [bacterium]|nr:AraC family transcriptional regulator [bacterium]